MPVVFNASQNAPGVYVQEVPSGSAPIAGVGTSTAGFIGVIEDHALIAGNPNPKFDPKKPIIFNQEDKSFAKLKDKKLSQDITWTTGSVLHPSDTPLTSDQIQAIKAKGGQVKLIKSIGSANLSLEDILGEDIQDTTNNLYLKKGTKLTQQEVTSIKALNRNIKVQKTVSVSSTTSDNDLSNWSLAEPFDSTKSETIKAGTNITQELAEKIVNNFKDLQVPVEPFNLPYLTQSLQVAANEVILCTNFSEFKKSFGDFSIDKGQNILAQAVYGFFRNGGTRCYVVRVKNEDKTSVEAALEKFEAIDEIAIIAAPGITDKTVLDAIASHCKSVQDRVAILDSPRELETNNNLDITKLDRSNPNSTNILPDNSDYAAFYFPWIKVFDPITKLQNPSGDGLIDIPPSGHIAGVYARVDTQRGVYKAPANEVLVGVAGLKYNISKNQQAGLNSHGINCIRYLNGNIRVWGARTIGGDDNGEFKYINVRRLFNYLRESIDEGNQWTVFEPNSPDLWARIRRNVNAFLLTVWRSGALFGDTPEQAFYVKCDEETNPPEYRDRGMVVTEIGVAVVKPAEFVIFQLSQWAGSGSK
ncbi:phage tail sheath family protein [Anabaena sp. UHCC 0399]|uniref:phage tail sheath family protein n=1 Tax=Anabaena sp. UHCC 0399 TaxID=3110238 RepID=UPI002B1FB21E|nr:phage tail sheath subtilisin-like domain-containing protein [Anabaena sp. UHCC 0399]MEA5567781.1 phage tail sheath subtilisin-like domain-containing protein [Anabaena sp. UHCC 0399]